jgi:hypothetical protein
LTKAEKIKNLKNLQNYPGFNNLTGQGTLKTLKGYAFKHLNLTFKLIKQEATSSK